MIKAFNCDAPYPSASDLKTDLLSAKTIYPLYSGLHGELNSVAFYSKRFVHLKRNGNADICDLFLGIIACEIKHFSYLGKAIFFLGAIPKIISEENYRAEKDFGRVISTRQILLDAVSQKSTNITEYERVKSKLKSESVMKIIERIIIDERLHLALIKDKLTKS